MKIRQGFVSNSSASSFTIHVDHLDSIHLTQIHHHTLHATIMGLEEYDEPWDIYISTSIVRGDCDMNNFDMRNFLEKIGIPPDVISWGGAEGRAEGEWNWDLPEED